MTFYLRILLVFFTGAIFVSSCKEDKKETRTEEKVETTYDRKKQLDSLNKNESNNLSIKYNSITGSDTTIKYTFQLQEKVTASNRPISIVGTIKDIVKKDGDYIIKVYGTFAKKDCFGDILITSTQLSELSKGLDTKKFLKKVCFVFSPSSITSKSMLSFDSEVENASAEDVSSYVTYSFPGVVILCKGKLIDFYIYKRLEKGED